MLSIQKASKLLQPDRVVKSEFFALTEIRHICLGDVQLYNTHGREAVYAKPRS